MKHFGYSLLSLPLLLASCACLDTNAQQVPSRMDRTKLNIGTYYLQKYAQTETHVKELAECGIDFVYNNIEDRKTLDYFQKYGVGVIAAHIIPSWWGGDGSNAGKMRASNPMSKYEEAAKAFQDHPAIWGIDTGDEPSALDFPYYGEVFREQPRLFPKHFFYLNLYPNYASVAQNNAAETISQLGTKTYEEHIARYCEEIDADYICYDYYMYAASVQGHYENLRIVSDACRASGRSMWIVLQVNSSKPEKWISLNQLRAQAYSSMAFGAENIIWACYTAGWWHNQVLDENGVKTQQYEKLKTMNGELHLMGDAYMRFRNASTHFVGFEKDSPWLNRLKNTVSKASLSNGIFRNVKGSQLVIGEMTSRKEEAERALMIFAADDPMDTANKEVMVTFCCNKPSVSAVGSNCSLSNDGAGNYTLTMRSNGGALIIAK